MGEGSGHNERAFLDFLLGAIPKAESRGVGFLGGSNLLPTSYGVWGSAVSSPSWVRCGAPDRRNDLYCVQWDVKP